MSAAPSRRLSAAPSSERPSRQLSRRTWRLAVAVFLTVFLAGSALSGAWALWSQSASVSASISTGTWGKYSQPGWALPLTVTHRRTNNAFTRYDLQFTWAYTKAPDTTQPLTYRVEVTPLDANGEVTPAAPVTVTSAQSSASFSLVRDLGTSASYRLTITPVINGVNGASTTRTIQTTVLGGYTVS
jgi:hypothetical protein